MIRSYITEFIISSICNIQVDRSKVDEFKTRYGDWGANPLAQVIDCLPEAPTLGYTNDTHFSNPIYNYTGSMILRLTEEYHLPLCRLLNNFEYGDLRITLHANVGGVPKTLFYSSLLP